MFFRSMFAEIEQILGVKKITKIRPVQDKF